jgi:hypothetical protein
MMQDSRMNAHFYYTYDDAIEEIGVHIVVRQRTFVCIKTVAKNAGRMKQGKKEGGANECSESKLWYNTSTGIDRKLKVKQL